MLILEIRPVRKGSKRYTVRVEGLEPFVLYSGEIRSLHLEEGDELSSEIHDRIVSEILLPRAKKRALHLLEQQDRTGSNLLMKLREGGYPSDIAAEAVEYAASFGYVDDERFAINYIEYHQESRSRLRIERDLLAKGISRDMIGRMMDEYYTSSQTDQIIAVLEKKKFDPEEDDRRKKDSIYRLLLGRGYSPSDISDALDIYCHKV